MTEHINKHEESNGKKNKYKVLLVILMFLIAIPTIGVAAYFYEKSFREIFILLLIITACFAMTVFSFFQSNIYNALHYDNGEHFMRFEIMVFLGTVTACLLPLQPGASCWAIPSFALALALFSNTVTGIIAYAGLISICAYFVNAEILTFLLYFLTGAIFAVLFEKLDNDYKTRVPMFAAMTLHITGMISKVFFENHGVLEADMFIMPIINIFITFIIMLAVLRFYCAVVIDKEKGKYLRINDQEFSLLAKYEEEDRQVYYNAIHTAHFAEMTARLLHMDVDVAKNGGYYHKIIALECKKQEKTLEEVCAQYRFPPKAVQLLQEYNYQSQPIKMRETVAVYLADNVISTIMYLIKNKKGEENNDYAKIATAVIHRKIESGILSNSDISLADLGKIEKIYTGEKLYYDFLRRE